MPTLDERIEALKTNPEFIAKTKHYTQNTAAYELSLYWTKLEWHDHAAQLIGNLIGSVDPEVFQEALDDIGE